MKVEFYMKITKRVLILFSAMSLSAFSSVVLASGEHSHDHHETHKPVHEQHTKNTGGMFLVKKEIDGYDVTFHVMKAKPGMEMGGTHDVMIKIESSGKATTNLLMNTKVKFPDGTSQTKKTMVMGEWLMAGYDLGQSGKHQLMILFKTADGKKHKGGVYYP